MSIWNGYFYLIKQGFGDVYKCVLLYELYEWEITWYYIKSNNI